MTMSVPPEADGEADVDGPDVVPAARGDVEHLPRMQEVLLTGGSGELWEHSEVRMLCLNLPGYICQN